MKSIIRQQLSSAVQQPPKQSKMKSIVLVSMLVAVAFAAPQEHPAAAPAVVPIVRDDSQINGDGSYQYSYQTGNGIIADQKGELKKVGDVEALEVQGEFKYPGENGQEISLVYTADENGFHPQGAHLPTAPPVPEAIQRSLAYLATAAPAHAEAPHQQ